MKFITAICLSLWSIQSHAMPMYIPTNYTVESAHATLIALLVLMGFFGTIMATIYVADKIKSLKK